MAGHSHWAGIKHKKALTDAKRGKLFSKVARLIIVAARSGGGDIETNLRLKYAIDKARAANMTNVAITRAVKKGTGELEGEALVELMYEGYAPGGIALLIEALTDNRNRSASTIRGILDKRGAAMAEPGAVAWQFEQKGVVTIPAEGLEEEALMEIVMEAEAEDFRQEGDRFIITCEPRALELVRQALTEASITIDSADLSYVPKMTVPVAGKTAEKLFALLDALEDDEDVQKVHSNLEITPEELARIAAASGE